MSFLSLFLTPRLGIKACVVINPLLGITWLFGLLLPVHKAFAYIFTILNSTQVSVQWLLSKIIQSWLSDWICQPSETPLQWLHDIYWNYENKKLLTMLNKIDFFFISWILPKLLFISIWIDISLIFFKYVRLSWFTLYTACETIR